MICHWWFFLGFLVFGPMPILAGQAERTESSLPPGPEAGKGDLLVFYDMSELGFEWTFIVTAEGIWGQKATFPVSRERELYWLPGLPRGLADEIGVWSDKPGEVTPPTPRGWLLLEPYDFHRVRIPQAKGAPMQYATFGYKNTDMEAFLRLLRKEVAKADCRIEKVPQWILDDDRVRRCAGFHPGIPTDPDLFRMLPPDERVWQERLIAKLQEARRRARRLTDEGKHLEAAVLLSNVAAAVEVLGAHFPKHDEPNSWELDAMKKFQAAGKEEAYANFLRAKYPSWKPPEKSGGTKEPR